MAGQVVDIVGFFLPDPEKLVQSRPVIDLPDGLNGELLPEVIAVDDAEQLDGMRPGVAVLPSAGAPGRSVSHTPFSQVCPCSSAKKSGPPCSIFLLLPPGNTSGVSQAVFFFYPCLPDKGMPVFHISCCRPVPVSLRRMPASRSRFSPAGHGICKPWFLLCHSRTRPQALALIVSSGTAVLCPWLPISGMRSSFLYTPAFAVPAKPVLHVRRGG